jgi:hypothetical protein
MRQGRVSWVWIYTSERALKQLGRYSETNGITNIQLCSLAYYISPLALLSQFAII